MAMLQFRLVFFVETKFLLRNFPYLVLRGVDFYGFLHIAKQIQQGPPVEHK